MTTNTLTKWNEYMSAAKEYEKKKSIIFEILESLGKELIRGENPDDIEERRIELWRIGDAWEFEDKIMISMTADNCCRDWADHHLMYTITKKQLLDFVNGRNM